MWKSLPITQTVNPGDKIRFNHSYHAKNITDTLFKVVKADQHYFEILPIIQDCDAFQNQITKQVVRYFDIGYNINIEIWDEMP